MFGKIKDRLKGVFEKNEEVIEDGQETQENEDGNLEEDLENFDSDLSDIEEDKKKGFFGKLFNKKNKDEEEVESLENLEDEMLEDVSKEEKDDIENKKDLKDNLIEENKKDLENKQEEENKDELELVSDIENVSKNKDDKTDSNIVRDKNLTKELIDVKEDIELKNDLNEFEVEEEDKKEGFFSKTFKKLKSKEIDDNAFSRIWVELEIFLLEINIAFEIVEKIESRLKEELIGNSFDRFNLNNKIREVLSSEVEKVLILREADLILKINEIKNLGETVKIIVLGVNGTGKTTSIAKFVNYLQKQNLSVVVAAADTFRAAAIEQLGEHANNLKFKLISHKGGSDPAAVAFDAVEHAKAKNIDVVLIDTAGRMPNNSNLMVELQKIKRVTKSQLTIFIGDSISGNDLVDQIGLFDKAMNIDGVILTKVDTDERPGSIVTCAYSIEKPIYFLGVGQGYDDLVKFDAKEIAKKLFSIDDD